MPSLVAPRYPAPLRACSGIVVTAPSSGVEPHLHRRLDIVIAQLQALGFVVEEGDLAPGQDDPLTAGVMPALALPAGSRFTQRQSTHWQKQWTDFAQAHHTVHALTEPTRWWALDGTDAVHFQGRLLGGCLDTLMHLAGSMHGDVAGYIARCHAAGDSVVLYLENAEQSPAATLRALHRLRWSGWLDGLAGVLIGRSAAPDTTGAHALRWADALRSTLGSLPCPVLVDVDIGHRPPQLLLVNGARAVVRWSTAAGSEVVQWLT